MDAQISNLQYNVWRIISSRNNQEELLFSQVYLQQWYNWQGINKHNVGFCNIKVWIYKNEIIKALITLSQKNKIQWADIDVLKD